MLDDQYPGRENILMCENETTSEVQLEGYKEGDVKTKENLWILLLQDVRYICTSESETTSILKTIRDCEARRCAGKRTLS